MMPSPAIRALLDSVSAFLQSVEWNDRSSEEGAADLVTRIDEVLEAPSPEARGAWQPSEIEGIPERGLTLSARQIAQVMDALESDGDEWRCAAFEMLQNCYDDALSPPQPRSGEARTDSEAARSAAKTLLKHASRVEHTEAISDCWHCNAQFLARWALDALGLQPATPAPPGPPDPPCRHPYADLGCCIDCGKQL